MDPGKPALTQDNNRSAVIASAPVQPPVTLRSLFGVRAAGPATDFLVRELFPECFATNSDLTAQMWLLVADESSKSQLLVDHGIPGSKIKLSPKQIDSHPKMPLFVLETSLFELSSQLSQLNFGAVCPPARQVEEARSCRHEAPP